MAGQEFIPNIWTSEQIISFDLHCVLKWESNGDLVIDYQPLYNNKQFMAKVNELLEEFGFPKQELHRAELGMQGCPPVYFEGVKPPIFTKEEDEING